MQEDLLHELRAAAPMPAPPATAPPATAPPATATPRPRPDAAPRPEEKPGTTLELRLTPQRWSALRIGGVRDGSGLRAAFGPVRLSLRKPGR